MILRRILPVSHNVVMHLHKILKFKIIFIEMIEKIFKKIKSDEMLFDWHLI